MFIVATVEKNLPIRRIDKIELTKIYKSHPFIHANRKNFFWDYLNFQMITDDLIEAIFLKHMNNVAKRAEKYFAFKMLDSLMIRYRLKLKGIGVVFSVHESHLDKYGEIYIKKFIFKKSRRILNYAPDKKEVDFVISREEYLKILWITECRLPNENAELYHIGISSLQIYSLILT